VQALIEGKGWEFLRLRIVSLSRHWMRHCTWIWWFSLLLWKKKAIRDQKVPEKITGVWQRDCKGEETRNITVHWYPKTSSRVLPSRSLNSQQRGAPPINRLPCFVCCRLSRTFDCYLLMFCYHFVEFATDVYLTV